MNIGQAIKKARKKRGFNQSDLCELVGMTQGYLSQIENGLKKPSFELVEVISKGLNVPIPVLMFSAITEADVHPTKKEAFKLLKPSIDNLIAEIF